MTVSPDPTTRGSAATECPRHAGESMPCGHCAMDAMGTAEDDDYVRRTGTTSPEMTEDFRVVCRHCKAELPALGDHTCPCPFSDEECPDHV